MHHVYIVRCADGTLYTGYAKDPKARETAHNAGRGAKYTSGRRPVALLYVERCSTLGSALKRERAIKRLKRIDKERLVTSLRGAGSLLRAIRRQNVARRGRR